MVDQGTTPRRIPEFLSREEEAAWWDSHLITDYLDEMEPAKVRFAKHLSRPVSVRLEPLDHVALTDLAHAQGIGPSALVRMRVKERLKAENAAHR